MKTTEVLKKLKDENISIPEDWAVLQTSTGNFVKFMPYSKEMADSVKREGQKMVREMERMIEKYMTEKQAVKDSKLLKI